MRWASGPTGGNWRRPKRSPTGSPSSGRSARPIPIAAASCCWASMRPSPSSPPRLRPPRPSRSARASPSAAASSPSRRKTGSRAASTMPRRCAAWPAPTGASSRRGGQRAARPRTARHCANGWGETMARMTMAQALLRHLAAQMVEIDGREQPLFAGVFAIFGHGNVAGIGQALAEMGNRLPTFRAHNEQAMAHAAIAFAKASNRRRMMVCTSSVGPGATNMVTAAALAHVNRLPVLLLPGDVFAGRRPDPVLQQVESFADPTVSANDCFRPVARYWDRITRPEQLLASLPQAIRVLTDPGECGPVVLALPQDVQAEAAEFPESFFAPRLIRPRRPAPDADELAAAVERIKAAKAPIIVCGGGVHYSE